MLLTTQWGFIERITFLMSYRRWEVERKVRAHGKNRTWLVLLHKLYHKVAFSLLTKQFPVCSNSVLQTIISEKYFPRKEMGHKFTHTHTKGKWADWSLLRYSQSLW